MFPDTYKNRTGYDDDAAIRAAHDEHVRAEERRRRQREEDARLSDESTRRIMNAATGDCLNTGIPGGIDCDFSTPC